MSAFQSAHLPTLTGFSPVPGVQMTPLAGDSAMLNYIAMEPGSIVPLHSHPHEQLGFVLTGEIAMNIAGVVTVLRPGDAYTLPGDIEHSGTAGPVGCVVVDVFAPVREDYRERAAEVRAAG